MSSRELVNGNVKLPIYTYTHSPALLESEKPDLEDSHEIEERMEYTMDLSRSARTPVWVEIS